MSGILEIDISMLVYDPKANSLTLDMRDREYDRIVATVAGGGGIRVHGRRDQIELYHNTTYTMSAKKAGALKKEFQTEYKSYKNETKLIFYFWY